MSAEPTPLSPELYAYLLQHNPMPHPVLADLKEITSHRSDRMMQVSQEQGAFLQLITSIHGSKRILEIGCFTGYSAIAMASGMAEGGRLYTCDIDAETMAIAKSFFKEAQLSDCIDPRLGPALSTIEQLVEECGRESFDQVFIDADKANYIAYFDKALPLLRPGGIFLVDNTLWSGKVCDEGVNDESTQGIRAFNQHVLGHPEVQGAMLPIADGLYLLRKKS